MDMARIVCCGCGIMLMYTRSATSVRCSCCHTLNLVPGNIIAKSLKIPLQFFWFVQHFHLEMSTFTPSFLV